MELTHTLDIERPGLIAGAVILPLHDALLEDLFDQVEAALSGVPLHRKLFGVRSALSFFDGVIEGVRLPTSSGRRAIGLIAALALIGIAALHALWAAGVNWPAANRRELADVITGLPGPVPSVAVAGALSATALAVESRTSAHHSSPTVRRLAAGTRAAASGVFALRGILSAIGVGSIRYRRRDLALYSPLCLALATSLTYANSRPGGRATG